MSTPVDVFFACESLAVVGVSRDPAKYGYKVFQDLKNRFPQVFAVNPNADRIDADVCFPSLLQLPLRPEAVVTVVPPPVTERLIADAAELGVKAIWMQPGSESMEALKACEERQIYAIAGACLMQTKPGDAS